MGPQNEYTPPIAFHPGETLEEKLDELRMGPKEFAIRTNKPEKTISAVLKGQSAITPDMAMRFESVTKIPAHFWMNTQKSYDEYIARQKQQAALDDAVDWMRKFPMAVMAKLDWISKKSRPEEKSAELLDFFGFANHKAWEEYYFNQQLKVAFRISLASIHEPYAISAWLRRGEIQASKQEAGTFSERAFKKALPEIKSLMAKNPANFFEHLKSICAQAGVKVVHTPCLPKAPLNGSARWLKDTPLIQLTGRYKRNDIFWFTFFHEVGHILLHGKKDIFLEDVEYDGKNQEKEEEADEFATHWTLTTTQEKEVIDSFPFHEEMIRGFAKKFETHPAIIIGRLQHRGHIHPSQGRQFIEKIELA